MDEDGMSEDDDFIEIRMANDADADTAAIIQMAALMLNDDGGEAFVRAHELPLASVATTLALAASMIATLVEQLAEHEDRSPEQVLLELRNWMEDIGEGNG